MEDSEQKTSWDERVKGAVAYACGEVIGYFVLGVMWLLYNMVGSLWTFAGVAAILCGVVIVVLAVNTIILDDAG
jgi:sulfite exporter TauE/SafE